MRQKGEKSQRLPLRMLLIMASSAMLGGATVALWNRKALQQLRQGPAAEAPKPDPPEYI